jgi:hypothetical protein
MESWHTKALEAEAKLQRAQEAFEDIAKGMIPHDELDVILELSKVNLAEARGKMYGWCQKRANAALRELGSVLLARVGNWRVGQRVRVKGHRVGMLKI